MNGIAGVATSATGWSGSLRLSFRDNFHRQWRSLVTS